MYFSNFFNTIITFVSWKDHNIRSFVILPKKPDLKKKNRNISDFQYKKNQFKITFDLIHITDSV